MAAPQLTSSLQSREHKVPHHTNLNVSTSPRLPSSRTYRNAPTQRKTRSQFITKSLTHRTTISRYDIISLQSDVGTPLLPLSTVLSINPPPSDSLYSYPCQLYDMLISCSEHL